MKGTRVVVAGALLGTLCNCSASSVREDAGLVVRSGHYELQIIPLPAYNVGPRLETQRDGSFVGHGDRVPTPPDYGLRECRGSLTADEGAGLVDALNNADALRMTDQLACGEGGADANRDYRVSITIDDGATNGFCYKRCRLRPRAFDQVLDVAYGPNARALAAGACDGPPYVYDDWSSRDECPLSPAP